jgi:intein/homing endonuclease
MLPPEEKIFTLGYKDDSVIFSRILSMNRQSYSGDLMEISVDGKKVIVTPEHKVFTKKETKRADKVSEKDLVFKVSTASVV